MSILAVAGVTSSIAAPLIVLNNTKGGDTGSEITKEHNIVVESSTKYNVKVFKKGTTTEVFKAKKGDELTFLVTCIEASNSLQPAFIKINNGHYQLTKSATDEKWEVTVKIELVEDMYVSVVEQDISGSLLVTFKDGSETISTQKVVENEKAIKPQDPTKDDYSFVNWYDNESCEGDPFNFDSPITKTTTLYAKWTYDFAPEVPSCKSATTLFALEQSTVYFNSVNSSTNMQYSTTGAEGSWADAKIETKISIPKGGYLYLKGNNSTGLSTSDEQWILKITGKCNVGGSVMGLLDDGKGTISTIPSECCFYSLFSDSSGLYKVNSNFLPSKTLQNQCYREMFSQCISLVNAPKLPAETLTASCYDNMFYSCSTLATAPSLPATTLAESCYNGMFSSCYALKNAPALSANTLMDDCYTSMFDSCYSLTATPDLPAKQLAKNCYNGMFANCYSLTIASDLNAPTCVSECYRNMFASCHNLIKAPSLPAKNLAENCYNNMFVDCYSLKSIPELPVADTLGDNCYWGMFANCSSLKISEGNPGKTSQGKIFACPNWSDVDKYAQQMFKGTAGTFYNPDTNNGTPNATKDYYWYTE